MSYENEFQAAAKSAISEWLNAHTVELIAEIAKQLPDTGLFVPLPKLTQALVKIRRTYTDPDEYRASNCLYADMVLTSLEMELTQVGYAVSTESPEENMRKAWSAVPKG